jgi:O-antigen ligase
MQNSVTKVSYPWAQARPGARPLSRTSDGLQLGSLPIPELMMGLLLLALSRALAVGGEVSWGRTTVLSFVCALITLYGVVRNQYTPFYVYGFIAPTFEAFGTSFALISGGTLAVLLHRATTHWKCQFSWAGLTFCLWSIASLIWAERLYFGQAGFLVQTVPPMLLATIIAGIRDPLFRRNLVLMVIGACVVGSLASLRNWSKGIVEFGGGMRVYSLIRPDIFSAWELFGLMGALAWLLAGWPAALLRSILICSVPLILMGLGLSGYRAAILSAGLGIILIGICQKRFLQGMLLVGLITTAAAIVYLVQPDIFAPVVSRFQTIQEDRGSERMDIWAGALQAFRESPVLGTGCDNFKSAVSRYYGAEFLAHSIYIGTLVELGIVGATLMLCWFAVLFRKAWRAQDRLWVFPLLGAYLCQAAFLHEFYFGCFWLALGLVEGAQSAGSAAARVPEGATPTLQRAPNQSGRLKSAFRTALRNNRNIGIPLPRRIKYGGTRQQCAGRSRVGASQSK